MKSGEERENRRKIHKEADLHLSASVLLYSFSSWSSLKLASSVEIGKFDVFRYSGGCRSGCFARPTSWGGKWNEVTY